MNLSSRINVGLKKIARQFPQDSEFRMFFAKIWDKYLNSRGFVDVKINLDEFRLLPQYRQHAAEYEKKTYSQIKRMLYAVDGFIDVGANLGLYSMLAGRIMEEPKPIISIEANPFTYKILTQHLSLNNNASRVSAFNKAAAEKSDLKLRFLADPSNAGDSQARITQDRSVGVDVDSICLDKIERVRSCKMLLVKIDVEGAELSVLKGAEGLLKSDNPPIILLAIHPMFLPEFGVTVEQIHAYLNDLNYVAINTSQEVIGKFGYDEYWMVPKGKEYILTTALKHG